MNLTPPSTSAFNLVSNNGGLAVASAVDTTPGGYTTSPPAGVYGSLPPLYVPTADGTSAPAMDDAYRPGGAPATAPPPTATNGSVANSTLILGLIAASIVLAACL